MAGLAFTLDSTASSLTVRTRAKGLLARLAHDLEIIGSGLTGRAEVGEAAWSGDLVVPVGKLAVAGALHGDRLDSKALSPSDRAEIERRLRDEVLSGARDVTVSAAGATRERGEARFAIGSGPRVRVPLALRAGAIANGMVVVTGAAEVSLRALGVAEIRGPLGAFKVSDAVEIQVALTFRAEG